MYAPTPEQYKLLEQAIAYRERGDVYHAVKLYRLLIRQAPEWLVPHRALAQIYKDRKEWKAVAHYNKKTVALDPSLQDAWWDLAVATFAIGKKRQARRIWNKFGPLPHASAEALSVQIAHHGLFELIWVKPLSPVSGAILSIPHPQAEHNYRDIVLFDREVIGFNVRAQKKVPVYPALDIVKRSYFNTFSGVVYGAEEREITLMGRLANEAGVGFEVWSNASRSRRLQPGTQAPEFYSGKDLFGEAPAEGTILAFAGRTEKKVRQLIRSWEIITLKNVEQLEQHG